MDIYINQKRIKLSPRKAIGKGGEADVFKLDRNTAVKIFKPPNHPDYQGLPIEQKAAELRIKEHQIKLKQFPQNLPSNVITPKDLATDQKGNNILGYTMPFVKDSIPLFKYSDRNFRSQSGIENQTIIDIFVHLHQTVSQIHQAKVVIGDFNDLNILILNQQVYLIDADSYQYKNFICKVFTNRFVDPILCDANQHQLILSQSHNNNSDWYSFTVMLMQCLLFVDPYGGIYKPKDKKNKIPHTARPLKRITVFHPEVKYPKPAIPYNILPDELLQYFHSCFEQDYRGQFPLQILENINWTKCVNCGKEHARNTCPFCTHIQPQLTPPTTVIVRGNVKVTQIFVTKGVILTVKLLNNNLAYLYYEKGEFKREDNQIIFQGDLDPNLHFWLKDRSTLVGKQGQVIDINNGTKLAVDSYQNKPMLRCNSLGRYWLYNGQLLKDGKLGSEYIGDILPEQTQFWLGSHFGFGFYRAGNINIGFIFDAKRSGINDSVKIPYISGELVEANCIFSHRYCWFFLAIQEKGKLIYRVYVIESDGKIIATENAELGDNSWLNNTTGYCAVNQFILVPTDEGIVRVEPNNDKIIITKEFPDTEPFVNSSCQLFASADGLYVVSQQEINLLQIQ
jgi:tRNA A-37 threonylcarbamoyl transferase component Bud32